MPADSRQGSIYAILIACALVGAVMITTSTGENTEVVLEGNASPGDSHTEEGAAGAAVGAKPQEAKHAEHALRVKPQNHHQQLAAVEETMGVAAKTKAYQKLVAGVSQKFRDTSARAKKIAKSIAKKAQQHATKLQRLAKVRAAKVLHKARKTLRKELASLKTTLTASVDARQRAAHKLAQLKARGADEVELATEQLEVAKVNQQTHLDNAKARATAKAAHERADEMIRFARNTLATRLKAIETTAKLTARKARLQANVVTTEAEEALSKTKQGVLMELADEEPSISLVDIVGKESTVAGLEDEQAGTDKELSESIIDEDLLDTDKTALSAPVSDTILTVNMQQCKFPYMYNGRKFFHCSQSPQGAWCATDVHEKTNEVKKWQYCLENKHVVKLAKQAAMQAAKIEINRVLTATGSPKLSQAALREALRAAAAARASPSSAGALAAGAPMDKDKAGARVDSLIESFKGS